MMPGFELLVSLGVRVSLVFSACLVLSALLGRVAASYRRLLLLLGFVSALLLAVVVAALPSRPLARVLPAPRSGGVFAEALSMAAAPSSGPAGAAARAPSVFDVPVGELLVWLWLCGVIALLVRLGYGVYRAELLVRRATPSGGGLALSSEVEGPLVVGLLRPTVLLPSSASAWCSERQRLVLSHERAHLVHGDGRALLVAELACALYWFHPLAWVARRALRRECELAADEAVLSTGVLATTYAGHLLAMARALHLGPGSIGMAARPSELARRIEKLVSRDALPRPLERRRALGLVLGAVGVLGVACAAAPSREAPPARVSASQPQLQRLVSDEARRLRTAWRSTRVVLLVLDAKSGALLGEHDDEPRALVSPASTLKPLVAALALDSGRVTEAQRFDCGNGQRPFPGGLVLRDAAPYGSLDLAGVLAVSSNVGLTRILDAATGAVVERGLERFRMPAPAPIREGTFDGAVIALGQRFRTTPHALARAYTVFANAGRLAGAGDNRTRVVSEEAARAVLLMLENAVSGERATGRAAQIAGVRVAGKTGTTQDARAFGSFVGLLPAEAPRFVVYVGIESETPELTGGAAAAPAFARLGQRLLDAG